MNKFIGIIAGLTAASLAASAAAQEQGKTVPCLKRSVAIKHLGKKFSEIPVATGLTNSGAVLEVLSSKTGKNWTTRYTTTSPTQVWSPKTTPRHRRQRT